MSRWLPDDLPVLDRRLARLMLAGCLALLASLAALEWRAHGQALRDGQRTDANLAASVADHADQVLARADAATVALVALLEGLEPGPAARARLRAMVLRQTTAQGVLRDLMAYDATGHLRLSSFEDHRFEPDAAGRDFFRHHAASAREDAFIGAPFRLQPGGDWVIPVSRRLADGPAGFTGVAVALVDQAQLQEYLAQFDVGRRGSLRLHTGSGHLLAARGTPVPEAPRGHAAWITQVRVAGFPVVAEVGSDPAEVMAAWQAGALRTALASLLVLALLGVLGRRVLGARRQERQLAAELDASRRELQDMERAVREHAVVAVTDVQGRILSVNDRFCELSGYTESELVGRNHRMLRSGLHPPEFYRSMWRTIGQGGVWKGEIANRRKDGSIYHMQSTIVPLRGAHGRPERYIAVRTDVTPLRELAERLGRTTQHLERANLELETLAATDGLTWLANRRRIDRALADELRRTRRDGQPLALLMVDVDCFKAYNDSLGHVAGDECLRQVATAIKGCERRVGDLAARWGGEEFALLLPCTDEAGAVVVAETLREAVWALNLPHPAVPCGRVTVSVGAACLRPGEHRDTEASTLQALVEAADRALYTSKALGRNRVSAGHTASPRAEPATAPPSAQGERRVSAG